MDLARVTGSIVASVKETRLTGTKLLIVEAVAPDGGSLSGSPYVAVDLVGAGDGEMVVVVRGSSAARAVAIDAAPIDAAIVGIVDSARAGGRTTYEKK